MERGRHRRDGRRRPRRGLTLVEVMVVIAIIIVLMGLVVPSVSKIGAEARAAVCQSNLRQNGVAIASYRSATRGLLPNCEPLPVVFESGPQGGLNEALRGYVEVDAATWICPEDDDTESLATGTSYFYVPGIYVLLPQIQFQLPPNAHELPAQERHELEARLLTVLFEGDVGRTIPLLMDSQDRHEIGTRNPRNGLYMDGSARIVKPEPPAEESP